MLLPGQFLFFAKGPVFVQQEVYREAQDVIDEGHRFLGDAAHLDPQKGEQTAQADAGNTVDHIHLHKGFFPGCTGGAEHIAPVKEEGPGHTEDKAENKRYQEVITGKPPQALQPPKNQIINAQIHQGAAETNEGKQNNLHHTCVPLPFLKIS